MFGVVRQFLLPLCTLHLRANGVFHHLCQHQRHGEENLWAVSLHDFHYHRRYRQSPEDNRVHTCAHRCDEVAGQAEDMRVGQDTHIVVARAVGDMLLESLYIPTEVPRRQHHAFGVAGGAGGVHDSAHLV